MKNRKPILLVDDDNAILEVYKKIFEVNEYEIIATNDSNEAIEIIKKNQISVLLSDIIMPKTDGMTLLKIAKELRPEIEVIMFTAEGTVSGAVEALKKGAFTYLVKPVSIEDMLNAVGNAYALWEARQENITLKEIIRTSSKTDLFVGKCKEIESIKKTIEKVSPSQTSILITGESGTGKEVLAKLIHDTSNRKNLQLVAINCASFNENLIESELFGHEKGAYTGADKRKKGRFELADGGTLFLDEIGEMPLSMQVKLLRVLQEKTFERVGGIEQLKSDFRLIAATNRDLKEEVKRGTFREDLYYRIKVIHFNIPPLRDRGEDVIELFHNFVKFYSEDLNKNIDNIDYEVYAVLRKYSWPGNVRELKNIVERMIVLSDDGRLDVGSMPHELLEECGICRTGSTIGNNSVDRKLTLKEAVKIFEKEYISDAIEANGNNISKTAEVLGIARKNLYAKMKDS